MDHADQGSNLTSEGDTKEEETLNISGREEESRCNFLFVSYEDEESENDD